MSMAPIKLQKMLHCIILPMESRQRRGRHILVGCYVEVVVILGGEMEFHMDWYGGSEEATGVCSNLGYLLKHVGGLHLEVCQARRTNKSTEKHYWRWWENYGKLLMWVKPSRLIRIVRVYTSESQSFFLSAVWVPQTCLGPISIQSKKH